MAETLLSNRSLCYVTQTTNARVHNAIISSLIKQGQKFIICIALRIMFTGKNNFSKIGTMFLRASSFRNRTKCGPQNCCTLPTKLYFKYNFHFTWNLLFCLAVMPILKTKSVSF